MALCLNATMSKSDLIGDLDYYASLAKNPDQSLEKLGPIVRLGNANIKDAEVIFLPEIHDDYKSLLAQLLLLSKFSKGNEILVMDESLKAFKKSGWDLFSQKSMEIVAALQSKGNNEAYSPRVFEKRLSDIANNLSKIPGQLRHLNAKDIWAFEGFKNMALPFYGWDSSEKTSSLTKRNLYMVSTIDSVLKKHSQVVIMSGARHVPDLEYESSKLIICSDKKLDTAEGYFSHVENKYGSAPNLSMGIGSTLPIYNYLKDKKYAVVFTKGFFDELRKVMTSYHKSSNDNRCVRI